MVGSQLVIQALARRGVTTVFSLSGNQIMPLYDACIDAGIRIVHVRHEAAAVFMADAWAQVTGEIGVAMLTAGPGIANGIAPLYSALQAESPVLLLSGDSPLAEDGMGSFQELDQAAMTRPLTKLSQRITSMAMLTSAIDDGVDTALAPRRGPVHLALPFDLLNAETGLDALPLLTPRARSAAPAEADVRAVAALFARAQRPIVLGGPTSCRQQNRATWHAFEADLQAPVLHMESPRGLKDPSLGEAAVPIGQADLVVVAGKCIDFTLGFGRTHVFGDQARVVVVDPDPAMLARARHLLGDRLHTACLCDPAEFLNAVVDARVDMPSRSTWRATVSAAIAARVPPRPADQAEGVIGSGVLCEQVQRFLEDASEPILICDGGEFGQWAQAFCAAPLRIINGMSGAIGGGICYAIAAKIARPNATVVALMGDGTSGFHFMEFDTAVREDAAFIAVIGNDLRWNAEHVIQMRTYGEDRLIGCTLAASANYHDGAKAMGGFGVAVHDTDQIAPALQAAAASGMPACVNVAIDGQPAPTAGVAATAAAPH